MTELINYSEFDTLTSCERKFVYAYVLQHQEDGAKKGLHLGTLCHLWHGRWLLGLGATLPTSWTDDINTGGKPGEQRTLSLSDFDPALVIRAEWLAERFVACYGDSPPSSWTVISAEAWMTRDFGDYTLVGRTDGFVEIDGELWLIELKTYGARPGPLAYAQVSPQLGCYSLLAEEHFGKRPFGVLYQGIYTYQWKPEKPTQGVLKDQRDVHDPEFREWKQSLRNTWAKEAQAAHPGVERPPAESFDQIEVELGAEHLATARNYLGYAVLRRHTITETELYLGDATPGEVALIRALPNVGRDCSWCGFRPQCWNDLGGVEEFEIEVEDEDAEPV